ncbi:uncharacterized protein [Ptychodera flava]|uniref:uncharacterized protein n=1 Tax=Ptychodera flava TaxID=63121 RepID=UPI00396AADB3
MSGKKKIYVRHARVKGNLLPLHCLETDTIHELAQTVKDNAELFDLKSDDIKINTICLVLKDDRGTSRKLEFFEPISVIKENDRVELNEEQEGIEVFIKHRQTAARVRFKCSDNDRVSDVPDKIRQRLEDFRLIQDHVEEIKKADNYIILKPIAKKKGDSSKVVDPSVKIIDIEEREFEFAVQRRVTLDNIKAKCHGINIAFIGTPGHGKSSTINTIMRALSKLDMSIASTWTGATTGTVSLAAYKINVRGSIFTCIDFPGPRLQRYSSEEGKSRTSRLIRDIFDGKYPANELLDYFHWYSPISWIKSLPRFSTGAVHTVIYVHKGNAEQDRLCSTVIEIAKQKGREIPVLVIITHIDKMTTREADEEVQKLSAATGIDRSRVFRFSNLDHEEGGVENTSTSDKSMYVREALFKILTVAENFKNGGILNI